MRIAVNLIIWDDFIFILQEHLNLARLRLLDTEKKLKKLKQRSRQIVAQLATYLDILKTLLSESLPESQRVNNLFFALHDYIQRVIKRKQKSCVTR